MSVCLKVCAGTSMPLSVFSSGKLCIAFSCCANKIGLEIVWLNNVDLLELFLVSFYIFVAL